MRAGFLRLITLRNRLSPGGVATLSTDFGRIPSDARNRRRLCERQRRPSSIDQLIPKRRTADHVLEKLINYQTSPDLAAVVRSLNGGRGVDRIINVF